MAHVYVDIDLSAFDDDDLLAELRDRGIVTGNTTESSIEQQLYRVFEGLIRDGYLADDVSTRFEVWQRLRDVVVVKIREPVKRIQGPA